MQQESTEAPVSVSSSDPWQKVEAESGKVFYETWLALQCKQLAGVYSGLLAVNRPAENNYVPVALWPHDASELETLSDLIEQVIASRSAMVTELAAAPGTSRSSYGVACPVVNLNPVNEQNELLAIVAVAVVVDNKIELRQIMQQLRWGAAWIRFDNLREHSRGNASNYRQLSDGVDLLAKVLAEDSFGSAAMRLVSELSMSLRCDLVSLGFIARNAVRISHLSHSAEFGKKMQLIRAIEAAMDEAADQRKLLVLPGVAPIEQPAITLAHEHLLSLQKEAHAVLTLPLYWNNQCVGAVNLLRARDNPFTRRDIEYCESVTALAVPALEEKRLNDRALVVKIKDAAKIQLTRMLGTGHATRKVVALSVAAVSMFFTFAESEYKLSADAILATALQRVVVAPYDGYIEKAPYRAGDVVQAGDLLVKLDAKELQLEILKWRSQSNKLSRQYQQAISHHDRAQINIIDAQLEQARAQLKLVESQIQRASQVAPFRGLIISGDLSQKLGNAVSQGDVLFTVSPVDSYRIHLQVKESRIADVKIGQTGTLYLSALPQQAFKFTVDKLTPVTSSIDGASYFRVEAQLEGDLSELQPGMEGIGKIAIDRRKLLSIWSRELIEWTRLKLWAFWG